MVPIGAEVILNKDILEESDRKKNFFIYERYINGKISGKVKSNEKDGRIWVTFLGSGLLLWPQNVIEI